MVFAIRENAKKGVGIFLVDGKMLDIAFVEGAERTLSLAKATGLYKGDSWCRCSRPGRRCPGIPLCPR